MTYLRLWCAAAVVVSLGMLGIPTASAAGKNGVHVYLLRGIFNVSSGLDDLSGKLARLGIANSVHGHSDQADVVADAVRDYRKGKIRSIILIGHSLGAGAVLSAAQDLREAGVPVALLIALDPVMPGTVASNVRRAVNYYVNLTGTSIAADKGFRGELKNVNVSDEPGMNHMSVQSAEAMHTRMIGFVRAAASAPAGLQLGSKSAARVGTSQKVAGRGM